MFFMISANIEQSLISRVQREIAVELDQASLQSVTGGQTHRAYRLDYKAGAIFLKINDIAVKAVMQSEYQSLHLLAKTSVADLYPQPYFLIEVDDLVVMGTSFVSMVDVDKVSANACAKGLISHHQVTARRFGWQFNNFIGSTEQNNTYNDSWVDFYRDQRFLPQLALASKKGLDEELQKQIRVISDCLEQYLPAAVQPCLLHFR